MPVTCKYIINDVEYTKEELKQMLLEKGMGVLLEGVESPSPLASVIVERYDFINKTESIMEL
jgi:hypothetical protein